MADQVGILSRDNLATIVAVSFVLALLALAFSTYTYASVDDVAVLAGAADAHVMNKDAERFQAIEARIAALEGELKALKEAPPAPAPAPVP